MISQTTRRSRQAFNVWPGFVDALATLSLVFVFMLLMFMVGQLFLAEGIGTRNTALQKLSTGAHGLADALDKERAARLKLNSEIEDFETRLKSTLSERDTLAEEVNALTQSNRALTISSKKLNARLNLALSQTEQLNSRIAALQEEIDTGAEETKQLSSELMANAQAFNEKELENSSLNSEINQLDLSLSELQMAKTDIEAMLLQSTQELKLAKNQIQSLARGIQTGVQTLQNKEEAAKEQAAELEGLQDLLTETRTARDRINKQLDDDTNELNAVQLALKDANERENKSQTARDQFEQQLKNATQELEGARLALQDAKSQASEANQQGDELKFKLSEAQESKQNIQISLTEYQVRAQDLGSQLKESEASLQEERRLSSQTRAEVVALNQQISGLREKIEEVKSALGASEQLSSEQEIEISDLGEKLNLALLKEVKELNRYRSDFFGGLSEALGKRDDISIVGDRFLIQSELLFNSGSATLGSKGETQLGQVADTLAEIAGKIPDEIDWVLQVNGHTDKRPINTPEFPSNWELSSARAITILRFLTERGIPTERLAAAGFAEFQPLDNGDSEESLSRNRRIELKLTNR